ncbi:hypothetical protein MILLY_86 [Mycobacterium phage Milly]|uniref:hypothetical protein n=1 Tax=Mycobacterium phage Milly TaxID=1567473 RepID=UPI000572A97B|nr:hypothetical protein MILLY_86 [Mycobacterium phage Milly]AJA43758.1 hypothetical protein MILLY_86 [Mycobacterium phage Milly]
MYKMIVQLHGRTEVTEHATIAEARERLLDIAVANRCRITGDDVTGEFILRDRDGNDDPRVTWTYGAYRIEAPVTRIGRARIFADFTGIDSLAAVDTVEVKAANLKEGMVLVDPDLGTPAVGIDHRIRATRGTGNVSFLVADLDDGGWRDLHLRASLVVKVVA